MFISAYDTTACLGFQQDIKQALEEISKLEIIGSRQLGWVDNPFKDGSKETVYGVRAVFPGVANIRPFAHPIVEKPELKIGKVDENSYTTYVDLRSYCRLNSQQEVVVTALRDYKLNCYRGALQTVWSCIETCQDLLNLGDYQTTVYARWISETLARRLTLPPEVQMNLAVYAAYFYLCQFITDDKKGLEEKDYLRMASSISRSTYVNVQETLNLIEDLPVLTNIESFINLLKEKAESSRYEQLNLALFTSIFSGSWVGANSREISIVAIEHVPTFIALLALATSERSATVSVIGKIAETFKKTDQPQTFLYNLSHLLRG